MKTNPRFHAGLDPDVAGCPRLERRLATISDRELTPAERAELASHLDECSLGRDEHRATVDLQERLRTLPRAVEPPQDLWPDIVRRIDGEWSHRRITGWQAILLPLAAAASLVVLIGGSLVGGGTRVTTATDAEKPLVAEFVAAEQEYHRAAEHLAEILARSGSALPEATRTVLKENLAILDRAIAETRTELKRQPQQPRLAILLGDMYMQKGQLLRHAATFAAQ